LGSTEVDAAKRESLDDLLLYGRFYIGRILLPPIGHTSNSIIEYNPLDYNSEDWSILNDFEFGFMPSAIPSISSPLELKLGSPTSSSSFTTAEDPFDETEIDPNILSCHLYDEPVTTSSALLLVSTRL
jgi:hypothetical protein